MVDRRGCVSLRPNIRKSQIGTEKIGIIPASNVHIDPRGSRGLSRRVSAGGVARNRDATGGRSSATVVMNWYWRRLEGHRVDDDLITTIRELTGLVGIRFRGR